MEKVHFRATWSIEEGLFKIKFQFIHGDSVPGSPAFWDVESHEFLKMVEKAEKEVLVKDGQNKVGKSNYAFEFVDKLGNDCEVRLSGTDRDTFGQLTEYLRKVYDSWLTWKTQVGSN